MTPATIIRDARSEGVILAPSPAGTIKVTGQRAAVNRWRGVIREHKAEIVEFLKADTGDTATVSRCWLLHFPDRDPVAVTRYPETTHAEILERYPDAIAAEPFTPIIRRPSAPITFDEESAIRSWLAKIDETDPEIIAEVLRRCQSDADARDYFTERARSLGTREHGIDD